MGAQPPVYGYVYIWRASKGWRWPRIWTGDFAHPKIDLFVGFADKSGCFEMASGAVAQLGERGVRNAEVGSSSLLRSTLSVYRSEVG